MIGSGFSFFGRVLILLQLFTGIRAWGKEGHYATCKIAEGLLTDDAASAVKLLLPEYAEGDLASVCSWPDEIKHNYHWHWSGPLHYVDTPDFNCNYEYCSKFATTPRFQFSFGSHVLYFCVLTVLPLHVGFTGDEGGNTITVRWYRRKTNLHHVWDNMIIESAMKMFYNSDLAMMIEAIQRNIT
ncbi:hypothetical protein IFM89_006295, partial [Coptis chinensis]